MAHGLNPMIKREFDSSNTSVNTTQTARTTTTTHIQSTVANSVVSVNNSNNNSSGSVNNTTTSNNPSSTSNSSNTAGSSNTTKMGSRRIFTPQFKLQVLESYRNDSDCKGNQRATARKYGIHRRQIQKWLQCETNLRSSVANSNQNTVKHQFHNINHQMSVAAGTHTTTTTATTIGPSSTTSSSSNNNHQHHHHQQHQPHHQQQQQPHLHHHQPQFKTSSILSLDTARHSVALTSIPARATTKCVNGANIIGAAAVAAVAAAGSSPTLITNTLPIKHQPYKTSLSGTILATHTPAALQSSPLIQHLQSQQQQQHQQQHYHQQQTHHHHHYQQLQQIQMHQQQQQQQNHQHENLLMPSASLPGSPALVAANQTHELRDYQPIGTTENCYINESYKNQHIYENLQYYNRPPSTVPIDLSLGHRRRDDFIIDDDDDANDNLVRGGDVGIISEDLKMSISLKCDLKESWKNIETNNNNIVEENTNELVKFSSCSTAAAAAAVDLTTTTTCRKRKYEINVVDDCDDDQPTEEKLQKISYGDNDDDGNVEHSVPVVNEQPAKPVKLFKPYLLDDNDNIDGSVTQEKKSTCEHDPIIWSHHPAAACSISSPEIPAVSKSLANIYDSQCNKQCNSASPSTSRNINFLSNDGYPFPAGSPTFQSSSSSASSISSLSNDRGISASTPSIGPVSPPAASSTTTTTTTLWCPKGSPVSGYDTASTYSDSSDYYKSSSTNHTAATQSHYNAGHHQGHQYYEQQTRHQEQIYSIDFQIQSNDCSYYHDMTTCRTGQIPVTDKFNAHRNEVQRWLERDSNLRQGIALYV